MKLTTITVAAWASSQDSWKFGNHNLFFKALCMSFTPCCQNLFAVNYNWNVYTTYSTIAEKFSKSIGKLKIACKTTESSHTQNIVALQCLMCLCRHVSDGDVQSQERRLLQTVDMIISKKKRWGAGSHSCHPQVDMIVDWCPCAWAIVQTQWPHHALLL